MSSCVALLYTKAWTKASLAAEDRGQDLSLCINLGKHGSVDPEISAAARKALETTSGTVEMRL